MTNHQLQLTRHKIGLTQKEMAQELNTPLSTYQKWEQGRRRVPGIVEVALKHVEGTKMSRAEQMLSALRWKNIDWDDLLLEAEAEGDAYEQDYDNEMTYFEFTDGSVAVFCGEDKSIIVYGCRS